MVTSDVRYIFQVGDNMFTMLWPCSLYNNSYHHSKVCPSRLKVLLIVQNQVSQARYKWYNYDNFQTFYFENGPVKKKDSSKKSYSIKKNTLLKYSSCTTITNMDISVA